MNRASGLSAVVVLVVMLVQVIVLPSVAAQETAPEALPLADPPPMSGEVLLDDALSLPGAMTPFQCATGRGGGSFVDEGYAFAVTGPCFSRSTSAAIDMYPILNMSVADGEVRVEARSASVHDRVALYISVRAQLESADSLLVVVAPGPGMARLLGSNQSPTPVLARRDDLAGRVGPDAWYEVAIRFRGPHIWVLLNQETILSGTDPSLSEGGVVLGMTRLGDERDDAEASIVLRNFRVSALAP